MYNAKSGLDALFFMKYVYKFYIVSRVFIVNIKLNLNICTASVFLNLTNVFKISQVIEKVRQESKQEKGKKMLKY